MPQYAGASIPDTGAAERPRPRPEYRQIGQSQFLKAAPATVPATEPKRRILLVDDDPEICSVMSSYLAARGYAPRVKSSVESALETLDSEDIDVVLTDLYLGEGTGLDICRAVSANRPNVPVIVITGLGDMKSVSDVMRAGGKDFILKPFSLDALDDALERVQMRMNPSIKTLDPVPHHFEGYDRLIGRSRSMRVVSELIAKSASSNANVFIVGESGTGKELVARALHAESGRADKPFVAINCAAMPEALLESELFGHARGAFTDAKVNRRGLFLEASEGTLFLDEISEMPIGMQVKLLRAVQERTVRPVGRTDEVKFDVRIISATNRNIDREVEAGRFRADLYYRLNVVRIDVPPLRERGRDIEELAEYFLSRCPNGSTVTSISPAAKTKLLNYSFPGNVRELENIIERACALATSTELQVEDLPEVVRNFQPALNPPAIEVSELLTMDKLEKKYIHQVLDAVHGNKTHAAHVLEIDRKTLTRKLQRWRLAESRARAQRPKAE
jgi:two-component system response regulator HydG